MEIPCIFSPVSEGIDGLLNRGSWPVPKLLSWVEVHRSCVGRPRRLVTLMVLACFLAVWSTSFKLIGDWAEIIPRLVIGLDSLTSPSASRPPLGPPLSSSILWIRVAKLLNPEIGVRLLLPRNQAWRRIFM